tara:strand:- start:530 stop:1030 length:501 start_codon:yes stop_codon:yes gene_type:complete
LSFFRDYIERLKNTRKLAKEKNVVPYSIPVINSIGLVILASVYLASYSWLGLTMLEFQYVPFWWKTVMEIVEWLPIVFAAIICMTVLDRIIRSVVIIQAYLTKLIYDSIQRLDHKIWRKYGKDSYISNKIWKAQQYWVSLGKQTRRKIVIVFLILWVVYYAIKYLD